MATFLSLVRGYGSNSADLSAKYGFAVKKHASVAGAIALSAAGTDASIGILQNHPSLGQTAEVMHLGISKCMSGAAVALGALVASDASGKLVTAVSGDKVVGQALEAASGADVLFEALILPASKLP